jgi:hypothetical protein
MKLYLSHPITGLPGTTQDQRKDLLKRAIIFGKKLRACGYDVHIPAECEGFVEVAHQLGVLTVSEILEIDCIIIDHCDGVVFLNLQGAFSHGMEVEFKHAVEQHKRMVTIPQYMEHSSVEHLTAILKGAL